MTLTEFNARFLIALDSIGPNLKHARSVSNRRHPLLRAVLFKAAKEDIEMDGLETAWERWQHFCGGGK